MKSTHSTTDTIESLVELYFSDQKDHRVTHLFRESLFNLVRQAKSEQVLEMRQNVDKITSTRATQTAMALGKTININ